MRNAQLQYPEHVFRTTDILTETIGSMTVRLGGGRGGTCSHGGEYWSACLDDRFKFAGKIILYSTRITYLDTLGYSCNVQ